VLNLAIRYI